MTVIFRWARTVPHPPISFGTRGISADLSRSVITDLECDLEWLTSGASTRPRLPPPWLPPSRPESRAGSSAVRGRETPSLWGHAERSCGSREPGTAGVPGDSTRGTDGRTGTDLSAGSDRRVVGGRVGGAVSGSGGGGHHARGGGGPARRGGPGAAWRCPGRPRRPATDPRGAVRQRAGPAWMPAPTDGAPVSAPSSLA